MLHRMLSGAKARAVTTSAASDGNVSARSVKTVTDKSNCRAACDRKVALRLSDSTSVTCNLGNSGCAIMAKTSPGKPAPLPKSATLNACRGMNWKSWAESITWRRHPSRKLPGATKFMAGFHFSTNARKVSSLANVSRETSSQSGAIPRAKSVMRQLPERHWLFGNGQAPAAKPRASCLRSAPPQQG